MPATKVMAVVPGTSFSNIEGDNPTRYGALYKWKMKPGMYQRKTAAAKMRAKALEASGLKIRGHVMRTESGGDFMTFTQFIDQYYQVKTTSHLFQKRPSRTARGPIFYARV